MTVSSGSTARSLAEALVEAAGDQIRAILLYGSRLLDATPDRYSAYDFVVIVEGYLQFYRDLRYHDLIHRTPRLMAAAAQVLPPNVISFSSRESDDLIAKCLIMSTCHFERELSSRSKDHFMISRMIQQVDVLYVSDHRTEQWMEGCLAEARGTVLSWAAPYVESPFTPESLAMEMLKICYASEIRPESAARVTSIFQAQRTYLVETLGSVLDKGLQDGRIGKESDRYFMVSDPGFFTQIRRRIYLIWSKIRVTGRWFKHTLTFENWLPYIVRKVERRTGLKMELSSAEEALPLILLWPRLIKVLYLRPPEEFHGTRAVGDGDKEDV